VTKNATQPRIYCADLSSYGAGVLHGAWIDANQDADDIRAEIADMLRKSPHPNTTVPDYEAAARAEGWEWDEGGPHFYRPSGTLAPHDYEHIPDGDWEELCDVRDIDTTATAIPTAEEWAIHDYEGFEGVKLSEHEDIDTVAALAEAVEEHGEAFAVWWNNENRDDVDTRAFEDAYRGTYRTLGDYAEQLADDMGMFDGVNDTIKSYFDFERWAADMEMGGDIWTAAGGDGVYVFDNH
jgi:antirestriction protein